MSDTAALVLQAKENEEYRNTFIQEHKKFILKSAYHATNHYVTDSDDEWSIALSAFNEAIDSFEEGKGSFDSFAQLVIKRRLQNLQRSEFRQRQEFSTEPAVLEGDLSGEVEPSAFSVEVQTRVTVLSSDDRRERLVDEITALKQEIEPYGIDFFGLESVSPKAEKTRRMCLTLIAELSSDQTLMKKLRETRSLPITELTERTGVHKKVLERHRKYIIAAAEIAAGDYPLMKEYIPIKSVDH